MPLISVIIPVYNTEKFLHKCIDSVLAQTLSNIEVILINDGSTDNSEEICNNYSNKDKRIHVIHTSNQGVSHARNKGLETAQGKYIYFIDSDDWIEPNMIENLYQLIQRDNTELSTCGYIVENENDHIIYNITKENNYVLNKWDAIYSLFHDNNYKYKGNLWDKLYNKEIINKHNLKFNEEIYYNEDRLFIFQYINHCQSISYTTIPYYHYVMRNTSAINSCYNTYHKNMCTFMDAFDIMTSMSKTFPNTIKRALSTDYIVSSISFFKKQSQHITLSYLWTKIIKIAFNNYPDLSLSQKIIYSLHYIKIILKVLSKH